MTIPDAAPRLTKLELHGFKSFNTRTTFVFERGITAIIGPNGSGKSNISDAVRWVLGETSQSALRSRKTDDVIFAGGSGRAPSGMAEVIVTFDNSSGWLPIDFAEVTVSRRAFRSGDSHYLINGRRVRMKDVHQLVASLGQSYTVVGQGVMDAALSQRPEERRGLFEHAADLTGLRLKAVEAERSLNEADANATRLDDLLTELAPRLRSLERAARQAREWQTVRDQLRSIQLTHYRALYDAATGAMWTAESSAARAGAAVMAGESAIAALVSQDAAARRVHDDARAALERHGAHLQATADGARRIGHERDLANERLSALTRRREDMADTRSGLDEQAATVAQELATVQRQVAEIEVEVATAQGRIAELRRDASGVASNRAALDREASDIAQALRDAERRASDLQRRRALLDQRREIDGGERDRHQEAIAGRRDRVTQATADLAALDDTERRDRDAIAALDAQLADVAAKGAAAATSLTAAQHALTAADRTLGEATTRLDALQRLHDQGAGLHAGVRAVIQGGRTGALNGIRGTVGELIALPPDYDTAIEVALGGHLQDIVVDRWADAEVAITHLKRANVGRATFQPIETVQHRGGRGLPGDLERQLGVHGIASDLVTVEPEIADIAQALLGRMVVVDDLAVARTVLRELPNGWSTVTLAGEIARSGGSVTGGATIRESGTLARSRELRELPEAVRRLRGERDGLATEYAGAEQAPRRLADEGRAIETARAEARASARERAGQRDRLTRWLAELEHEQQAAVARMVSIADAMSRRETELTSIGTDEAALADERAGLQDRQSTVAAAQSKEGAAVADAERAIAERQRELATLEERLRAERRRQAGLHAQERALSEELALRSERAAALDGEITALGAQRDRLAAEASRLDTHVSNAQADREPLEKARRAAEVAVAEAGKALDSARAHQLDRERSRGEAGLELERARADLTAIELRITEDLDLDDPGKINDLAKAEMAWEDALSSESSPRSPFPSSIPDSEREITRLKERLRRIGYAGEDAITDYERESAQQIFLRTQLDDVQQAAIKLRHLLSDLHQTMRDRFQITFGRVAEAFSQTFTTLFGGGTARLIMSDGQDSGTSGGIDIVAQPPGKRLQNLALLSGGERSLTAAALLIAILRVNPTPFCMLDEVDAALDEANVVRFREQLRTLAQETQVIVITHNRGTIEIADTLYGITMGDDGVSRMLSMRMPDEALSAQP